MVSLQREVLGKRPGRISRIHLATDRNLSESSSATVSTNRFCRCIINSALRARQLFNIADSAICEDESREADTKTNPVRTFRNISARCKHGRAQPFSKANFDAFRDTSDLCSDRERVRILGCRFERKQKRPHRATGKTSHFSGSKNPAYV